jgi:hypothetical protein
LKIFKKINWFKKKKKIYFIINNNNLFIIKKKKLIFFLFALYKILSYFKRERNLKEIIYKKKSQLNDNKFYLFL